MPCMTATEQQTVSVVHTVDLLWLTYADDLADRFQPVVYFEGC